MIHSIFDVVCSMLNVRYAAYLREDRKEAVDEIVWICQ